MAPSTSSTKRPRAGVDTEATPDHPTKSVKRQRTALEFQKLKNIPKFLHSESSSQYFSKPWWKEMLAKDEFWEMLRTNLTQTVRNKRIQISFDTTFVQRAEDAENVKAGRVSGETATVSKKRKKNPTTAAEAVEPKTDHMCGECGEVMEDESEVHVGEDGSVVCTLCVATWDDDEVKPEDPNNDVIEVGDKPGRTPTDTQNHVINGEPRAEKVSITIDDDDENNENNFGTTNEAPPNLTSSIEIHSQNKQPESQKQQNQDVTDTITIVKQEAENEPVSQSKSKAIKIESTEEYYIQTTHDSESIVDINDLVTTSPSNALIDHDPAEPIQDIEVVVENPTPTPISPATFGSPASPAVATSTSLPPNTTTTIIPPSNLPTLPPTTSDSLIPQSPPSTITTKEPPIQSLFDDESNETERKRNVMKRRVEKSIDPPS